MKLVRSEEQVETSFDSLVETVALWAGEPGVLGYLAAASDAEPDVLCFRNYGEATTSRVYGLQPYRGLD